MITPRFSLHIFVVAAFVFITSVMAVPNGNAATAQDQPVAQKPPVARKPPQPRKNTSLKLDSYDSSWKKKAYSGQKPSAASPAPASTVPAKPVEPTVVAAAAPAANKTAKKTAPPAKSAGKRNPDDPAILKETLDVFAKDCIVRMNRQRKPGIASKEIQRQPDGSFKARYMAIDPDSLATSYNPTQGNKVIKYIGRMVYHEVEYISVGKDQKQALAGPFSESNRMPMTELIKYKAGKWSY